jgi:hypothetical protein
MYFRSVKVNGAMTDSQSTEFSQNFSLCSLCGFIAVGHAGARPRARRGGGGGPSRAGQLAGGWTRPFRRISLL